MTLSRIAESVLSGEKPGAHVEVHEHLNELFDISPVFSAYNGNRYVTQYAISAAGRKVYDFVSPGDLESFSDLGFEKEAKNLYERIKDMGVAEALSDMSRMEKVPSKFCDAGREKPEVAMIQGMLFGYDKCCVRYYINTRYVKGSTKHFWEGFKPENMLDDRVLCFESYLDALNSNDSVT